MSDITTIKFAKVREDAIIPSKRDEDAGFDIYACFDDDFIGIYPHETVMIPTGICCAFDSDYALILKERGSTGTKGIGQRAGIIDSNFRGEIQCVITNENDIPIIITKDTEDILSELWYETIDDDNFGSDNKYDFYRYRFNEFIYYPYTKAICQALLIPIPKVVVEEYTVDEIKAIPSQRGEGGWGSSGK
jgi:dUTP pyrophosphatase